MLTFRKNRLPSSQLTQKAQRANSTATTLRAISAVCSHTWQAGFLFLPLWLWEPAFGGSHLQTRLEDWAVSPWGKLQLCALAADALFHPLFLVNLSLIPFFFIWNPASGNFIIMGGNYNEGSWSCRLIGFFTSTGVDLRRPWAANLYIWSWGQDKGMWRKKRAPGWGVPFDFESPRSCFWPAGRCLWLERVSLASARCLSCTLMIWSVIGDVDCSEKKTPGAASDNLRQKRTFQTELWETQKKKKQPQKPVMVENLCELCRSSQRRRGWTLMACTGVGGGGNPACHPLNVVIVFSNHHLSSSETTVIFGTPEVSPPSQKSVSRCCITFVELLGCSDVPPMLRSWIFVFGHTLVCCLPNIHLLWFQLVFFFFFFADGTIQPRASAGARGPRAPRLLAYFWISVWHQGESLPQQEERSRRGSAAGRRPHAKPQAARSAFTVQTHSRSQIVFSCP